MSILLEWSHGAAPDSKGSLMFSLILVALILLSFAALHMAMEQGAANKAFALHMTCAATPVNLSQQASNAVLITSLHAAIRTPEARCNRARRALHHKVCGL